MGDAKHKLIWKYKPADASVVYDSRGFEEILDKQTPAGMFMRSVRTVLRNMNPSRKQGCSGDS